MTHSPYLQLNQLIKSIISNKQSLMYALTHSKKLYIKDCLIV